MATTIHVGNLSFGTDEEGLKNFFTKYGKVTDSYIVRRGGRPRGYGFIEFDSSESADNALGANGVDLDGRNINIEKAKGKIVKSNFDSPPRNRNDGYRRNDGGYRRDDGGYRRDDGGYRRDDGYRRRDDGGYRSRDDGNRNDGYRRNDDRRDDGYRSRDRDDNRRYNNDDSSPQRRQFNGDRPQGRRTYNLRPQGGRYNDDRRFNDGPRSNFRNGPRRNNPRRDEVEKEKSTSTVYVSNLPFSIDDAQLAKLFNKYQVKTTHVVQSMSGRSRGYGFVEFETEEDQTNAIKEMDNFEVKGSDDRTRNITVKVALVEKPSANKSDDEDDKDEKKSSD